MAFERLDSDHKGYITLDDITDMLGNDALHSEDMMREMWVDSMAAMNCSLGRITYEDFLLLMKGQTRDAMDSLDGEKKHDTIQKTLDSQPGVTIEEQSGDLSLVGKTHQLDPYDLISHTPQIQNPVEDFECRDAPPSMDEDDISSAVKVSTTRATPPTSSSRETVAAAPSPLPASSESFPKLPKAHSSPDLMMFLGEWTLPSIPTPSACVQQRKPAWQQDRKLYQAHRQMRLSVLEASKRFEEQQTRHAREVLLAQEELREMKKGSAGLIMRRVENKAVSKEQIKNMLEQNQKDRLSIVEVASRRSGRGIQTETISDIAGMLI